MLLIAVLQTIIIVLLIGALVWERRSLTRVLLITGISKKAAHAYDNVIELAPELQEGPVA